MGAISKDSVIVRLSKKKINTNALKKKAVKMNKDAIIDLNRDQMRRGEDGIGMIAQYSSASYWEMKRNRGTYFAPNGHADLYLTGSFQNKMTMQINGNDVKIFSRDSKNEELTAKYGSEIFDLNKNYKEQAKEVVTETYLKLLNEQLKK